MIDVKTTFGAAVRVRRNQLGLSQEHLAERADLHRTYVSDVERGARNVSLQSIAKLAGALETSVSTLFPPADTKKTKQGGGAANGQGEDFVEILLVEDDADDVELTLRAFTQARFRNRVQVIRDGGEALEYIFRQGKYARRRHQEQPQLVLLDLKLPKLNGIEVLRRIRANKATRSLPVVILTGSRNSRDMDNCIHLGVESYIVKPVNFQSLCQATPHLQLDWALLRSPAAHARRTAP